jgi:hypothetical protein
VRAEKAAKALAGKEMAVAGKVEQAAQIVAAE